MNSEPYEVMYDEGVMTGTAELYHHDEGMTLYFRNQEDHQHWLVGEAFRLINHWTKPAKPPRYYK